MMLGAGLKLEDKKEKPKSSLTWALGACFFCYKLRKLEINLH
jgi:hypothetical protein